MINYMEDMAKVAEMVQGVTKSVTEKAFNKILRVTESKSKHKATCSQIYERSLNLIKYEIVIEETAENVLKYQSVVFIPNKLKQKRRTNI